MKRKILTKYLKNLFYGIFFMLFVVMIATIHHFYTWLKPDFERGQHFDAKQIPYAVILTDRNDNEIFRSFDQYNREWIDLANIPYELQELTLIAEDQRFYSHPGIDLLGILRAIHVNLKAGAITQGASTLTQQLARKVFLTDDQTFERKFREMAIALGIESKLSKDQILELYLNAAPYGATLSGIKGASEVYFDKVPNDLTTAEILVLVSLPQNPVRLSQNKKISDWFTCEELMLQESLLLRNSESSVEDDFGTCSHLEHVFMRYAKIKELSHDQVVSVYEDLKLLELPPRRDWAEDDFQHWRFFVLDFLKEQQIQLENYPGGLRVKTSIDGDLQTEILLYLRDGVTTEIQEKHNANNMATIVLDHAGRQPLVWIGSKNFWDEPSHGQVDMLRSYRQIGSTMKPLVFSAFFDAGYDASSVLWDTRVRFNGQPKIIENADGRYYGKVHADKALAGSRNVPAAQSVYLAGGEQKVRKYLDHNFGFDINDRYMDHNFGWTIALGTSPVKLSDVSNAYATLATQNYQPLCPIMAIETMHGDMVKNPCECRAESERNGKNFCPTPTIDPATSFMISDTLGNEYLRDFGDWQQTANVAIKSGTSSARINGELVPIDNIMVGYTPKVTVMTWAGNTDGKPLNPGSFGSVSIGSVWEAITLKVIQKYPDRQGSFLPPENVKKVEGKWMRADRERKKFSIPAMEFVSVLSPKKEVN